MPDAKFVASPTSGNTPLTVSFTDNSIGATSHSWTFGDGDTSAEINPVHTYSAPGSYQVKLTVSNENGTDSKSAKITVLQARGSVVPVADFYADPTSGYAPLNVQFTDSSQNAAGWSWNFGDGATSNENSPSHTYSVEGTYSVILTVTNANGSASKETTITVQGQNNSDGGSSSGDNSNGDSSSGGSSHSSSNSGGGGGGSAGGSPEPQSNVEAKELSQTFITKKLPVNFDFPKRATAIVNISFDSRQTVGKTTTIAEMLKNKSILVSGVPADEVYKYLNIWVGNAGFGNSKQIENETVYFMVEKSWILDKNIDKSSITLNRYNDTKWENLPTNLIGEDDKYFYFIAETPGFSSFAIAGRISINEAVNKTESEIQAGPKIGNLENNASNPTNEKQTPQQTQSSNTKTPGFEIASVILGLFGVFLYKRR